MTVSDIRARVAAIEALGNDFERAHASEDALHQEVLAFVALGMEPGPGQEPFELAKEALKTQELDFSRYCA